MAYKLKPNEHFAEDSSLPVGISPIPSVRDSSEKQDREEPLPSADSLSIAALKANLTYAAILKQQAHNELVVAMFKYHQVLDALNQAIVKKNNHA